MTDRTQCMLTFIGSITASNWEGLHSEVTQIDAHNEIACVEFTSTKVFWVIPQCKYGTYRGSGIDPSALARAWGVTAVWLVTGNDENQARAEFHPANGDDPYEILMDNICSEFLIPIRADDFERSCQLLAVSLYEAGLKILPEHVTAEPPTVSSLMEADIDPDDLAESAMCIWEVLIEYEMALKNRDPKEDGVFTAIHEYREDKGVCSTRQLVINYYAKLCSLMFDALEPDLPFDWEWVPAFIEFAIDPDTLVVYPDAVARMSAWLETKRKLQWEKPDPVVPTTSGGKTQAEIDEDCRHDNGDDTCALCGHPIDEDKEEQVCASCAIGEGG